MPVVITGNNTPTAGGVVYGDGTTYATTTAGTSGRPIVSGGAGAPTFRPYTLPAADGSANQVLQTNGSGALSFATPAGGFTTMQVFTSTGTFTIPTGKTTVKVTVVGGGGSGSSQGSCCGSLDGNVGGNSSIASGTQSITTITGNGGDGGGVTSAGGTTGGTATNGDINIQGGGSISASRIGGASLFGFGGNPVTASNQTGASGNLYGGGGSGGAVSGNLRGGGGGGTAIKYLTGLTPGNTISVTVGTGGAAVVPGGASFNRGGAGAAGVVIFEY